MRQVALYTKTLGRMPQLQLRMGTNRTDFSVFFDHHVLRESHRWPEGPARNPHAIQRGHVLDISLYSGISSTLTIKNEAYGELFFPGDPTTPGYPSYHNASRVKNTNLPSIPSLPVSWANTQVLLQELKNSGKNISDREVRLVNNVNRKFGPIWNTMAVIPGHIRNEVVIAGNHRDAWVSALRLGSS